LGGGCEGGGTGGGLGGWCVARWWVGWVVRMDMDVVRVCGGARVWWCACVVVTCGVWARVHDGREVHMEVHMDMDQAAALEPSARVTALGSQSGA